MRHDILSGVFLRSDIADNILSAIRVLLQNAFLDAGLPTISEEEEGGNCQQVDQEDVAIIEALPLKMDVREIIF